jgi:formylglycine-generating enzyme required for sulfatase activity
MGGDWPPPAGIGNYPGEELQPALTAGKYAGGSYGVIPDYRDAYVETAPAGSFPANHLGLHDLSGNVWEWCEDWYDSQHKDGLLRGGSWLDPARSAFLSSHRYHGPPGVRNKNNGFRCVLDTASQDLSPSPSQLTPKASSVTATKDAPFVNTLGMKFVPVPITGGPTDGKRVLFSVWETREQDYAAFIQETKREWPYNQRGPTHPAGSVSWYDAQAFCAWLTKKELAEGKLANGMAYRLPSDHEWSCAGGIGEREDAAALPVNKRRQLQGVFPWGSAWPPTAGAGNFAGEELQAAFAAGKYTYLKRETIAGYNDGHVGTSPVGSFFPDRRGLYDLSGNVWEWCEDWFDASQKRKVLRGGSWEHSESSDVLCSSCRFENNPDNQGMSYGFRCVLAPAGP